MGAQLPAHKKKELTLDKVRRSWRREARKEVNVYGRRESVRTTCAGELFQRGGVESLLRPQGPAYLLDMHHITQGTAKGT